MANSEWRKRNAPERFVILFSLFAIRHSLLAAAFLGLPGVVGCASAPITADPVYFPPAPSPPRVVHLKSFNRLQELVRVRRSAMDFIRGRTAGASVGTPAGLAYRNGHLYICDTDLNTVHDWDLTTGRARRIGVRGDPTLAKPVAVAVDDAGVVYVADTERAEVIAFDPSRASTRRFRPPGREAYRPVSLAIHENKLCVADISTHRVDVFSTQHGAVIDSFGGVGAEPGKFYFPMGIATDDAGRVYVSDMMNGRVQVFDQNARPTLVFGRPGNRYGELGKPRHLAVAPDGVIFIADTAFAHVHLFNKTGQLLMLLGGPDEPLGGTPMPVGVAIAPDLPDTLAALVPEDFSASYYLFIANSTGIKRISLFAIGAAR